MALADDPAAPTTPVQGRPDPVPPIPPPSTPPAARTAPSGLGALALTALVAAACGLGGAFAHQRFFSPPAGASARTDGVKEADAAVKVAGNTPGAAASAPAPDPRELAGRLDTLSNRLDAIQKQVESQARPGPPPEVAALQVRIADLTEATNRTAPLPSRLDHLGNRVNELSGMLNTLRDDVTSFQSRYGPTTRLASAGPASRGPRSSDATPPPTPSTTPTPLPDHRGADPARTPSTALADPKALSEGADLFRRGRYKEARDAFNSMEISHPQDARVWYYAALSYGFTTKDWTEGAAGLVEKGVAREEAGTPGTPEIDAEFKGLDSSQGKDWLSAYRKRVRSKRE